MLGYGSSVSQGQVSWELEAAIANDDPRQAVNVFLRNLDEAELTEEELAQLESTEDDDEWLTEYTGSIDPHF